MTAVIQHSAETLRKRQLYSRLWASAVILWSVTRTVIIWAAVGQYGFNPWVYLLLDLFCSTIDAFTTPRMVLSFIDDQYNAAAKWATISLVAFIAPDIYIFLGTRHLPKKVIVVLVLVITAMLVIAVVTVMRKIRKGRAERRLAEAVISVHGHA